MEAKFTKLKKWIKSFTETIVPILNLIVAIIAVIVAIVINMAVTSTRNVVDGVSNRVDQVRENIKAEKFTITYPSDNSTVEMTGLIRGFTPYEDKNHYLVITPTASGEDWIQDGPVKVFTGGTWSGRAQFGTANVGQGLDFVVRAIATESVLKPGPLTEVPEDAVLSRSIKVTRKE